MSRPLDDDERAPSSKHPVARIARHWGSGWIWLVPLGALGLIVYLGVTFLFKRGPMISIDFETAAGLQAGQTEVRYKSVTLGTVEEIDLSDDLSHVIVHVRMNARAEGLLTEHARFWVVRPRLNGGLASLGNGLETLVSGAYVALDPGQQEGSEQRHFEGLETPPSIRSAEPGTAYFLEAAALGGVRKGAPIFYRDIAVGEVLSYELLERRVRLRAFIRAPYDAHVVAGTRFWNASGLRVGSDANGLRVEMRSVTALMRGGIAFRTPEGGQSLEQSPRETTFPLLPNEAAARVALYDGGIQAATYFHTSVGDLEQGSEVRLFGTPVGAVTSVELVDAPDMPPGRLAVRVGFVLQPDRLTTPNNTQLQESDVAQLVQHNLRVVLGASHPILGQKVLSLEYVTDASADPPRYEDQTLVLPSEVQGIEHLSRSLSEVANRINAIPFEQIGTNLNQTLAAIERTVEAPELERALTSLDQTLNEVRELTQQAKAGLGPVLMRLPHISAQLERAVERADAAFGRNGYGNDSTVQRNLERTLTQVADAARSMRVLADYLSRHPEAVLTGRSEEQP